MDHYADLLERLFQTGDNVIREGRKSLNRRRIKPRTPYPEDESPPEWMLFDCPHEVTLQNGRYMVFPGGKFIERYSILPDFEPIDPEKHLREAVSRADANPEDGKICRACVEWIRHELSIIKES